MNYLMWRNEVRKLASDQGIENWEGMATWRNLFLLKLTPDQALTKVKVDNF